ncbi:MAG TPA: hypothetical protein VGF24_19115 [Vicinamibacterales bacterium]
MPSNTSYPLDGLDANRRGELSDSQLRGFRGLSRSNRRSNLSSAAFFLAGAGLIGVFATGPAGTRAILTVICLALGLFLALRSIAGLDAVTRDLRRGRVDSIEGAIGKGRVPGRTRSSYFLEVGDRRFKVGSTTYRAVPDAGIVRVYFLPRSRTIVNLERLANPPLPNEPIMEALGPLGALSRSHNRREANEARARIASVTDAWEAMRAQAPSAPPPDARDPRPLNEAIVGTWNNGLINVTFLADGRVTARIPGNPREGHWSVDGAGRLHVDLFPGESAADAWIAGDTLTIAAEGDVLTFRREA